MGRGTQDDVDFGFGLVGLLDAGIWRVGPPPTIPPSLVVKIMAKCASQERESNPMQQTLERKVGGVLWTCTRVHCMRTTRAF
jgi:hypothetical protein|mmetsp:Transcript_43015/g.72558  ORF Transcript_43015/g.72558 Transcript_43015/m.72558 type:complete len:82 (+) Transcript_43015:1367-1612(+)